MNTCSNIMPDPRRNNLLWVVGPVVAGIGLAIIVVMVIMFKRRRHPIKQPMDSGQVMTPLMSGFEMQNASMIAPSDPVEMRRMNFQTPGMLSHPPIPITDLSAHIDDLKTEGSAKFTTEYESIEPGQQFTWDNSSMDINKPKNRYYLHL
jgi:netrin-G3 ligand